LDASILLQAPEVKNKAMESLKQWPKQPRLGAASGVDRPIFEKVPVSLATLRREGRRVQVQQPDDASWIKAGGPAGVFSGMEEKREA